MRGEEGGEEKEGEKERRRRRDRGGRGEAVLLREILSFLEDSESSTSTGVLLACCLIGTQLVRSGCLSMSWIIGAHTAIRLQGAIQLLLYRRMLKVRIEDKHSGQVVNHVTNDMERIFDAAMNGMLMLGTPVMFLLTLVYSCCLIGPWALMGNFIILLFYPIMGGIAGIIAKLRRQAVKKTDARVHLMAEVVNNIRLIKMYAWELPFITKVAEPVAAAPAPVVQNVCQRGAALDGAAGAVGPPSAEAAAEAPAEADRNHLLNFIEEGDMMHFHNVDVMVTRKAWDDSILNKDVRPSVAVKNLAVAVWGSSVLVQRTVTGVASNANTNKDSRPPLTPRKVAFLRECLVMKLRGENQHPDAIAVMSTTAKINHILGEKINDLRKQEKRRAK
ncbi:putative ABC transporter [Ixodes scapularis]